MKHANSAELLAAVAETLAGRSYVSSQLALKIFTLPKGAKSLTSRQTQVLLLVIKGGMPGLLLPQSVCQSGPWKRTSTRSFVTSVSIPAWNCFAPQGRPASVTDARRQDASCCSVKLLEN